VIAWSAARLLVAASDPPPQVTELVRIDPHAHDPSWPPVLIFCVAVVALGGLVAALVFFRQAWAAVHPQRRRLDG
jgi:hypothetical protein